MSSTQHHNFLIPFLPRLFYFTIKYLFAWKYFEISAYSVHIIDIFLNKGWIFISWKWSIKRIQTRPLLTEPQFFLATWCSNPGLWNILQVRVVQGEGEASRAYRNGEAEAHREAEKAGCVAPGLLSWGVFHVVLDRIHTRSGCIYSKRESDNIGYILERLLLPLTCR